MRVRKVVVARFELWQRRQVTGVSEVFPDPLAAREQRGRYVFLHQYPGNTFLVLSRCATRAPGLRTGAGTLPEGDSATTCHDDRCGTVQVVCPAGDP